MPVLRSKARAALKDSEFAYVDSKGRRRLPINDAGHVRNALARFEQTAFEDDAARERARARLLKAASRYGITPIGFFGRQLRKERQQGEVTARSAKMANLPKGNVTFLMADIEGSTPLASKLGDDYPAVVLGAWQLIRRKIRRLGGDEVDVRGDEYFAVFRQPRPALDAAIGIQLAMAKREWPISEPLRVRIGLHSGRPTVSDAAYVGIVVHTTARVCSAGHGGQILLSAAVREAVGDATLPDVTFRELGRYALAGLPKPEPLFQVEAPGLIAEFPRLRARAASRRVTRNAPSARSGSKNDES
jgi:class 3 adenylate cyclase